MELRDVLRTRRMVRDYRPDPVDPAALERVLDAASRVPSAGYTQGTELVVLVGPEETARYWDVTLPPARRAGFRWPGLLRAPVLVLPVAAPDAYVARYAEPDKAASGLGAGADAWPVPYWDVDAGMAVLALLLAAVDEGLGALFFGVFEHEQAVCRALGIPAGRRPVGVVAVGHPAAGAGGTPEQTGSPTRRARRPLDEVVHRGQW